jgi:hypothetical protein
LLHVAAHAALDALDFLLVEGTALMHSGRMGLLLVEWEQAYGSVA